MFRKKRPKVFCIGMNKTGTTSIEKTFIEFGYNVADEALAHQLVEPYLNRDFKSIKEFCTKFEAFQDAPFSWKYTYIYLDQVFPGSKFILSVRDSSEEWLQSLIRFHTKLFGKNGKVPTSQDLKEARRPFNRNVFDNLSGIMDITNDDPYNKTKMIHYYESHNSMVMDYFKFKNNLLIINLNEEGAYQRFCQFLGKKPMRENFPWENSSIEES